MIFTVICLHYYFELSLFPNRGMVKGKCSSWIFKEIGVCIKFSSKAVPDPRLITCFLWRPGIESPPLKENETLVSNVIELDCDEPFGIKFSGITVSLVHSATNLKGYELVVKELINRQNTSSKKKDWNDLKTKAIWYPSGMLLLILVIQGYSSFFPFSVVCRSHEKTCVIET